MKLLEKLYIISKTVRYIFLFSVFGVVSKCKHTPTCGHYFVQTIRKEGILQGIYKGVPRIIACY
jgi:putative component of membrane protein insertase Oxa1/YidC/SpoIIIJ protein YidD